MRSPRIVKDPMDCRAENRDWEVVLKTRQSLRFIEPSPTPQLAVGIAENRNPEFVAVAVRDVATGVERIIVGRCCRCQSYIFQDDRFRGDKSGLYCEDCR